MTHIEQAIREAMENGWENQYFSSEYDTRDIWQIFVCQPAFWQALGKARGWRSGTKVILLDNFSLKRDLPRQIDEWEYHWHRFIDHLAEGKDAESFFATLE